MKRIALLLTFLGFFMTNVFSDPPSPPSGGATGNNGTKGDPVGAPIDGGLGILLAMGAAYGGKKLYQARKENRKADNNYEEQNRDSDLLA